MPLTLHRPRLRTVLLAVNVLILLLPLGSIAAIRLYEHELLRSTEAQLLVQAVLVREAYLAAHRRVSDVPAADAVDPATDGKTAPATTPLDPLLPVLEVDDEIRPRAEPGRPAARDPDPAAAAAGAEIGPLLARAGAHTLAGMRVVDTQGIVVATSRSEQGLSLAHREEVARALGGQTVSLLRQRVSDEPVPPLQSISRGQRYRVFVALPVLDGDAVIGAVVLSRTPLDISKALYLSRRPLLLAGVVTLGVVVLVSLLTSLLIARPVHALIRQAEGVARGEARSMDPLARPGTREVSRLSDALAAMARALQDRADYIRTFASHVSHEFKTPLTTIRGTVELLGDHLETMRPDERAAFLHNLDAAAARLELLVDGLVEQARADVLRPGSESTEVQPMLDAVARDWSPHLAIAVDPDARAGAASIAPEVLRNVLGTLLDNARRHAGEGVAVRLAARRVEGPPPLVEIEVADLGPGVSAANVPRLFTPFFTTARETGGTGLGLSIVRSLVESHGGTITFAPHSPHGARFLVRLPARGRSSF